MTKGLTFDKKRHLYMKDGRIIPSVTQITDVIDKSGPLMGWAIKEMANSLQYGCEPSNKTKKNISVKQAEMLRTGLDPQESYTQEDIDLLINEAKKAPFRTSQQALNIGSQVHKWIEKYVKSKVNGGFAPEWPNQGPVADAVQEFLSWEEQYDVTWIESEEMCYGERGPGDYAGTYDAIAKVYGYRVLIDFKTSKAIYPEMHIQASAYYWAVIQGKPLDGYAILRVPKDKAEFDWEMVTEAEAIEDHLNAFEGCLRLKKWKEQYD